MTTPALNQRAVDDVAARWDGFGVTVFAEFTQLAVKHQAVNLGQGFPNFDGPVFIKDAAIDALQRGENQYARSHGIVPLNQAIADRFEADTGRTLDPDAEITITSGCTEAIPATMLGLLNPGDEVIVFEPFYDSYPACLAMSGAKLVPITLRPPDFSFDSDELRSLFNNKTRAVLINTPHNPTGKVFSREELTLIAELCQKHDALAITDEVYERLVFEGEHIRMATLPGMWERTVTLSSLGKTYSLTGWKIGWAIAPPKLSKAVRAAHQFLTYATATPLQHGAVAALRADDSYYEEFVEDYRARRDLLIRGLEDVGFKVFPPQGTYFILADHTPFGFADDVEFCRHLVKEVGVCAIPPSAFYHDPADGKDLVRFAFCKDLDIIEQAVQRMIQGLSRSASH